MSFKSQFIHLEFLNDIDIRTNLIFENFHDIRNYISSSMFIIEDLKSNLTNQEEEINFDYKNTLNSKKDSDEDFTKSRIKRRSSQSTILTSMKGYIEFDNTNIKSTDPKENITSETNSNNLNDIFNSQIEQFLLLEFQMK